MELDFRLDADVFWARGPPGTIKEEEALDVRKPVLLSGETEAAMVK